MTINTIESAIDAHIDWLRRFEAVLTGSDHEIFDLTKAQDDRSCELGRWLSDQASFELLGKDFHNRVTIFHATFHEVAGDVAQALNDGDQEIYCQGLLPELENLSSSLIILLNMIKRKSSSNGQTTTTSYSATASGAPGKAR